MAPNTATTFVFIRPLLLILIGLSIVLTAAALFSPSWRGNVGLITRDCSNVYIPPGQCGQWWDYQPFWLRSVIVLMIISLATEILILLWATLAFLGICLPPKTYIPLALLCGLSTILLITSIILYALKDWREINGYINNPTLGYSFWTAVVASIIMISATFVACGIAGLVKLAI
ncbi:hypothetical protein ACQ4LE_003980 [Meloidogyne hapla]|uniref:MARVEL domain-containing protein n=1 Tax=Meloidogyne hapla TaxID=6305 RepID=A0A1I8AX54_MELHA